MSSNHPITKRVQSKFQSLTGSSDCGCDSPSKKALVGNQKNLPDHIKSKILAAPETPAKQTRTVLGQKYTLDAENYADSVRIAKRKQKFDQETVKFNEKSKNFKAEKKGRNYLI